jgi:hypothetical protein
MPVQYSNGVRLFQTQHSLYSGARRLFSKPNIAGAPVQGRLVVFPTQFAGAPVQGRLVVFPTQYCRCSGARKIGCFPYSLLTVLWCEDGCCPIQMLPVHWLEEDCPRRTKTAWTRVQERMFSKPNLACTLVRGRLCLSRERPGPWAALSAPPAWPATAGTLHEERGQSLSFRKLQKSLIMNHIQTSSKQRI